MAELQGTKGVSHPNLVQMRFCCWEQELILVLEYFELGSLNDVLNRASRAFFSQKDALAVEWATAMRWGKDGLLRKISIDMASGMCFLSGQKVPVVHRDLKPHNVLLKGSPEKCAEWSALVSDFGESRVLPPAEESMMTMTTMIGTPLYMAPEARCRFDSVFGENNVHPDHAGP